MSESIRPLRLGVNVDHVATLRQARGTAYPSPLTAALIAQAAGADSITVHLREDRRHIQEQDVSDLLASLSVPLNLECAADSQIIDLATQWRPQAACLVPEKREELTTEGGLDVRAGAERIGAAVRRLRDAGTRVSLFVEPDLGQLEAIVASGAQAVEIHTGTWVEERDPVRHEALFKQIVEFAAEASARGLQVHAGHGLTAENAGPIAHIPEIEELNIGHSLVADAVLIGMAAAVARMKNLLVSIRMMQNREPTPAPASTQSYSAL